jgi:hypothetical protein
MAQARCPPTLQRTHNGHAAGWVCDKVRSMHCLRSRFQAVMPSPPASYANYCREGYHVIGGRRQADGCSSCKPLALLNGGKTAMAVTARALLTGRAQTGKTGVNHNRVQRHSDPPTSIVCNIGHTCHSPTQARARATHCPRYKPAYSTATLWPICKSHPGSYPAFLYPQAWKQTWLTLGNHNTTGPSEHA